MPKTKTSNPKYVKTYNKKPNPETKPKSRTDFTKKKNDTSIKKDYKPWAKEKVESTVVTDKSFASPKSSTKAFAKTGKIGENKFDPKKKYESFRDKNLKKYESNSFDYGEGGKPQNFNKLKINIEGTEENEREFNSDQKSTSWGKVATWYDKMINDENSYQNKVILPKVIRILEDNVKKNNSEVILDLGCGVGFFTEKFYNRFVDVKASDEIKNKIIGVDIGAESIEVAKTKTNSEIEYHANTAESLPFIKNMSVDKITIILALQNIKFVQKCISECGRVLKKNGKMIVVMNHPYFRIPKNTSWNWDSENFKQYRRVDRYLSPFEIEIDMNPGKKDKTAKEKKESTTLSFHRPMSWYLNEFVKQGLFVEDMQEWISHIATDQGPKKTPALEFARQEFPLFMSFVLVKK
jgi:ubiquinone/menaquinone biosynthesis C-methylase UbiE